LDLITVEVMQPTTTVTFLDLIKQLLVDYSITGAIITAEVVASINFKVMRVATITIIASS
jgi:hypothetical protein